MEIDNWCNMSDFLTIKFVREDEMKYCGFFI